MGLSHEHHSFLERAGLGPLDWNTLKHWSREKGKLLVNHMAVVATLLALDQLDPHLVPPLVHAVNELNSAIVTSYGRTPSLEIPSKKEPTCKINDSSVFLNDELNTVKSDTISALCSFLSSKEFPSIIRNGRAWDIVPSRRETHTIDVNITDDNNAYSESFRSDDGLHLLTTVPVLLDEDPLPKIAAALAAAHFETPNSDEVAIGILAQELALAVESGMNGESYREYKAMVMNTWLRNELTGNIYPAKPYEEDQYNVIKSSLIDSTSSPLEAIEAVN
jgi:hypothetical protein